MAVLSRNSKTQRMSVFGSCGWRRCSALVVLMAISATPAWAASWHDELKTLKELFSPAQVLGGMKDNLEYFRLLFTALGYGAVMISAIRKVAKARGGEESMGWVASMVMTVALMATAPFFGNVIFEASDDAAKQSKHDGLDSVQTCWDALLVIMPAESPVQEVLNDTAQNKDLVKNAPKEKQDASWTKLAWTWMKVAWSSMTNAIDKIGGALSAVANRILVTVLLFIPAITLLSGMIFIQIGSFLRELLHQSMDVFLPMMIAMLSFGPMRGAASNFIIKYISIALWPIAWALGNALACSILISVMGWVIKVCQSSLAAINSTTNANVPPLSAAAGFLSGAAAALPWGLLEVIVLVITLTSLLIIASAIGAPLALTATLTKGASFASAQLQQAASVASTLANAAASGGTSLAAAPAAAGLASSGGGLVSSAALRVSSSMSSVAGRLAPLGAMGGPAGMAASVGAAVLSRASSAIGSMAGVSSNSDSFGAAESSPLALNSPSISMMSTMAPQPEDNVVVGGGEQSGRRRSTPPTVARSHRRSSS